MSLTDHYEDWISTGSWISIGTSVVVCLILVLLTRNTPDISETSIRPNADETTWPKVQTSEELDWQVLQASTGTTAPENSSLAARFRLAGTFFSYGETVNDERKAIVDDIRSGTQRILSEGEEIDGVRVVRVFRDRIVLREGVNEEQLWLSFSSIDPQAQANAEALGTDGTNSARAAQWSGTAEKYGIKRVGERRWVFNRDHLLEYYQELMDEPERLVHVFDSLKPLYAEDGKITGYQLGIEGEPEFFRAVGFNENDIMRSVNSIPMTNRRHAEYFIHEFVNNRANAFVLEVERNGETRKLIYQMR